tara:strand:- start:307 stop:618 length:312 start_codon:yes stop_codon:yes gene_type:complete
MRVNISYSVELEDVPQEVERILIECDTKIRGIHGNLSQTIGRDPLAMIKELDTIRLQMAQTDLRLDDCMHILNGYVQAVARAPQLEHGDTPLATEPPEETEDE